MLGLARVEIANATTQADAIQALMERVGDRADSIDVLSIDQIDGGFVARLTGSMSDLMDLQPACLPS